MNTVRLKGDKRLRDRLEEFHLKGQSIPPDGTFSEMIDYVARCSEVSVTFPVLGLLLWIHVPIVTINFDDKRFLSPVFDYNICNVGANLHLPFVYIAPQRQCMGDQIFQGRTTPFSVAWHRAIVTTIFPWPMLLNIEAIPTGDALTDDSALSGLQETSFTTPTADATPNPTQHPIHGSPAAWTWMNKTLESSCLVTGTRTIAGCLLTTVWPINPTWVAAKGYAALNTLAFHSISIISQWHLLRRILQKRNNPAGWDERLRFEEVLAFRKV